MLVLGSVTYPTEREKENHLHSSALGKGDTPPKTNECPLFKGTISMGNT